MRWSRADDLLVVLELVPELPLDAAQRLQGLLHDFRPDAVSGRDEDFEAGHGAASGVMAQK
jgi:hypothetical protein